MFYTQINIGRNVDETPMDDAKWEGYTRRVVEALATYTRTNSTDLIMVHRGDGIWEGIREDSAYVSVVSDTRDLDGLREELQRLKRFYCQDSIALITDSDLI